ncbi:MAG TPA: hypothetical protein VEG35_03865, partial [Burkholderiales bacterium]|nr:hypothetical protein [Burkholderiales bacterium]
ANALAGDPAEKTRVLERAARVYPWNDLVSLELGKAHSESAAQALGNVAGRDAAFAESVRHFLRALGLNPGSAAAHFELAQTLRFMSYLSLPAPVPYFEEYKKAAALTGHNSQVYAEVGKVLLGRFGSLRPEERDFTLDILRKTLAGHDQDRLRDVLEVWYLHVRDYAVSDAVVPEAAEMLREYARFLGERSLSLEVREKALSRAEALDFERARAELERARRSFEYLQGDDAEARVSAALGLLQGIRFYQVLAGEERIDPKEHAQALTTAYLVLAKAQVDRTRTLDDPDGYLESYLALEDQPLAVNELEKFLAERGLLGGEEAAASRPKDLRTQALELGLDFKQNRYRDIVKAGEALQRGAYVIPEGARPYYARILGLLGDADMKLDDLYEAERAYLDAAAAAPARLADLARLERCYDRLRSDEKLADVRRRIAALLGPALINLGRRPVDGARPARFDIVCDGRPLTWTLTIGSVRAGSRPLLTVLWNGRVVREAFVEGGRLTFTANPVAGANSVVIETAGEAVTLLTLERAPGPRGRATTP